MPKKLTTEEFIEKATIHHNNKYDYSNVIYKNAKTKVIIICPHHGEFEQTPDAHLNFKVSGCKLCGNIKRAKAKTLTVDDYIKKAISVHGNRYDYSKVDYVNIMTPIKIICPVHGKFTQTPTVHLSGHGCQYCSNNKKLNTKQFIKKAISVHGNKYDYSKVDYITSKEPIKIQCKLHGEFEQQPTIHLMGCGCPNCASTKKLTTNEFIDKALLVHNNKYDYSKVDYVNCKSNVIIICPTHGEFEQTPSSHMKGSGCIKCVSGISSYEKEICEFLTANKIKYDQSNRSLIRPYELDIVIPSYKLAIEFNEIYWHSEQIMRKSNKNYRTYHQSKHKLCNSVNYDLISIFEPEWINNKDIIKSVILARCNKYKKKYGARKCIIQDVDTSIARVFLNDNHIQGYVRGNHIGLYYDNELVSLLTLSPYKDYYNLDRFVNKRNTLVHGAFSKLLNYFIKTYNPLRIITFADKRYFKGNIYHKYGFKHISDVMPSYYYFKRNELLHKRAFQKKYLINKFDNYDPSLTEYQNCLNNGYDRIWDSGKLKFELIL